MWPPLVALIALLGLAVVFVDQLHFDFVQAPDAFLALPLTQQLMLGAVAVIALYLVVSAIWQSARAGRQTKQLDTLTNQRNRLLDAAGRSEETQRNLNSAVEHLIATDPDNALMALHQRVTKAELLTAVQRGRSSAADMDARVNDIRRRQQGLREQLGEVTEARRAIAPVFDELRERQIQLDRALSQMEAETDPAGRSLADRLKALTEDVTHSQARLKTLEDSLVTVSRFREELAGAKARIAPLQAADDGIWPAMAELHVRHSELSKILDDIEQRDGEKLNTRVAALARSKDDTRHRVAQLFESASLLEAIRDAFDELGEQKQRLERSLSEVETDAQGRSLVDRQNELNEFSDRSRGRLGTLEHTLSLLNRFKEQLDEYQRGLAPLHSPSSGIEAVIRDLHDRGDKLHTSLQELEAHDGERLGARVSAIHRGKVETEQRIAEVVGHFEKLDLLRKDVDGLLAKLRFTIERLG